MRDLATFDDAVDSAEAVDNYRRIREDFEFVYNALVATPTLVGAFHGNSLDHDLTLKLLRSAARRYQRGQYGTESRVDRTLLRICIALVALTAIFFSVWTWTWWFGLVILVASIAVMIMVFGGETVRGRVASILFLSLALTLWVAVEPIESDIRQLLSFPAPVTITATIVATGLLSLTLAALFLSVIYGVEYLAVRRLRKLLDKESFDAFLAAKLAVAAFALARTGSKIHSDDLAVVMSELDEAANLLVRVRSRVAELSRAERTLIDDRFRSAGTALRDSKTALFLGGDAERIAYREGLAECAIALARGSYDLLPRAVYSSPVTMRVRMRAAARNVGAAVLGCLPLTLVILGLNITNPIPEAALNLALLPSFALAAVSILGAAAPLLQERLKQGADLLAYFRDREK